MFRFEEMFCMRNASVSYKAGIIALIIPVISVISFIIYLYL